MGSICSCVHMAVSACMSGTRDTSSEALCCSACAGGRHVHVHGNGSMHGSTHRVRALSLLKHVKVVASHLVPLHAA